MAHVFRKLHCVLITTAGRPFNETNVSASVPNISATLLWHDALLYGLTDVPMFRHKRLVCSHVNSSLRRANPPLAQPTLMFVFERLYALPRVGRLTATAMETVTLYTPWVTATAQEAPEDGALLVEQFIQYLDTGELGTAMLRASSPLPTVATTMTNLVTCPNLTTLYAVRAGCQTVSQYAVIRIGLSLSAAVLCQRVKAAKSLNSVDHVLTALVCLSSCAYLSSDLVCTDDLCLVNCRGG